VRPPFAGGGSPTLCGFESEYVGQGKKVTRALKEICFYNITGVLSNLLLLGTALTRAPFRCDASACPHHMPCHAVQMDTVMKAVERAFAAVFRVENDQPAMPHKLTRSGWPIGILVAD
jgi:hypothetical protein